MHPNGKLIILVDGDKGIGIADCALLAGMLVSPGGRNLVENAYNLEVSSPGIEAPLTLARQYVKNIGRQLAIKIADGVKEKVN